MEAVPSRANKRRFIDFFAIDPSGYDAATQKRR
jgi:hypothetical protein